VSEQPIGLTPEKSIPQEGFPLKCSLQHTVTWTLLILFTESYLATVLISHSKFISDESVGSAASVKRFSLAYWRKAHIICYPQAPLKGHH